MEAIILSTNPKEENKISIQLFVRGYGIYNSIARYAIKNTHMYQVGNLINITSKFSVEKYINFITFEVIKFYGCLISVDILSILAANSILTTLSEQRVDINPCGLFDDLVDFINMTGTCFSYLRYIEMELKILSCFGYPVMINRCAVTKERNDLAYVSPKSGNAVCKNIGDPYKNRLLKLPSFINEKSEPLDNSEMIDAMKMTGFFLKKNIILTNDRNRLYLYILKRSCIPNHG